MYRSCLLNSLSKESVGSTVVLSGWVDTVRDHGGLIFIDLRDVSGKLQVVIHPESDAYKSAQKIKSEFVIRVEGRVRSRDEDKINPTLSTGEIEVECAQLEVINEAMPLPFDINDDKINENLKFKYRYLSLRNPRNLDRIRKASELMHIMRGFLHDRGFIEVDTPVLTKSTAEGARDFLVPSRINAGHFYALPQSPQIFKQLLMVAGIDKYFQIAKCFRDEDLRSDRQPEFQQLDIEMSFVEEEDVMSMVEALIREIMLKLAKVEVGTIPRMKYDEAMSKYGSDKPDVRFEMLLVDITDVAKESDFKVFRDAAQHGLVKGLKLSQSISRREIDLLTEKVSKFGAKGLAWIKLTEEGISSTITKFMRESEIEEIIRRFNAKEGDTLFFVADEEKIVHDSLGFLRLELADTFSLRKEGFHFLWVTDFPMFEWSPKEQRYKAVHHPFTASKGGEFSRAYDLVLNGTEIGGGSIRIDNYERQMEVFEKLGMDREEAESQFTHLLTALRYGAPPHGGIAFGIARLLSIIIGDDSIRDVVAFPKTQRGICLLTDAPSTVEDETLAELHIKNVK